MVSNKKFGFFFTFVFLIVSTSLIFIYKSLVLSGIIFFLLSIITFILALFYPNQLTIFNKIWYSFGLFLNRIISPIILGFIFFCIISPIALCMRISKRDELLLKRKKYKSYWKSVSVLSNQESLYKNQY
tara:strand:- start:130 stop:516 length:387 start_codon:yes stop_codon:yes gene_type:complete